VRLHWRQPTLWFVVLGVASGLTLALSLRDWNWLGDALWGQETIGIAQVLVLPLMAGATAVVGWRDRVSWYTVLPGGRARIRHLSRTMAAWVLPLAGVYLVSNAFAVLASRAVEGSLHDGSPWPLATQGLGMVVACSAGYLLGHVLSSWAGALVAGAVLAATVMLDRLGAVTTGLAEYSASGVMLGARANGGYFLARVVWLLALSACCLALVLLTRVPRRVAGGALVVTLLVGTVIFRTNDSYRYVGSQSGYCAGTTVLVCGPPSLAPRVREAADVAAPVASALQALGVRPPRRLVAWQPTVGARDWVMVFNADRFRDRLDPGNVISALASPTSCGIWTDPDDAPPDAWFAADRLVRSYLATAVHRHGGLDYQTMSMRIGRDHAVAVVRASARALSECNVRLLPVELKG
jgi:hypothetical protein